MQVILIICLQINF